MERLQAIETRRTLRTRLNAMVGRLNRIGQIIGLSPVQIHQSAAGGTVIALNLNELRSHLPQAKVAYWIGRIGDEGPDSEADYADNRYWVREVVCSNDGEDPTEEIEWATLPAYQERWITATNETERLYSTHNLPVDGSVYVQVLEYVDRSDPPEKMYVFACGAFWM